MPAPLIGLPALLQLAATIGVGGAVGYKAQKDLKNLSKSGVDLTEPQVKMLRALVSPNLAVASEVTKIKDDLVNKSAPAVTPGGQVFGPDAGEIEKERERIKESLTPPVTEPRPTEPVIETLPAETPPKPEIPTAPEIDVETKEELPATTETGPIIYYAKAQEGGKKVKDITAGVSAQKDEVPELLEQGKLAMPIKKFFEGDKDVVNYKIGDTVGSYGDTVERSLDIEANVKDNFSLDKFGEVVKERAKEFDQDAVFVAESVPKDFEGANIGFELDFGSNLKMKDAINFANSLSETATVDGFTFKVKNLDSSGSSIYLPQTEKDLDLIQKSIKKYGTTENIRDAGFIMPDGKMLNFNLRGGNFRDTEHRRVGFLTTDGYNGIDFGPMYDWMIKTGGIRVTGNQNRLYAELVGKPTPTQIKRITDEYNQNRDRYDSMIISITMPGEEGFGRSGFGSDKYISKTKGIDLRKEKLRLPNESFYEVNGEEANANDILRKFKATDVVGKTFTGLRQLNIPEFSNLSKEEALRKIVLIEQNIGNISEANGLKMLDKPKVKFYNTKLYTKGKDY